MARPSTPKTIVLRSPDGRDVLRLTALGRDAGYPSLQVRVEAATKGFSGGTDAWIDGFALKEFAAAMARPGGGEGTLELRSMNPDELRLAIRSVAGAGRLVVEFALARNVPLGDRPEPVAFRVSGALELDPATLAEVLGGFRQLANAVAA